MRCAPGREGDALAGWKCEPVKGPGAAARYKLRMSAAASFGKTTLVLLGLWAVLAAVGLASGVIPLPARGGSAGDAAPGASADAGGPTLPDGGAGEDAGGEPLPDAGVTIAVEAAPPVHTGPALPRSRVCAEPALAPSLAVADVLGDAQPELVVGCGASWEVIGRGPGGAWMRVAHVATPAIASDRSPLASGAAAIDVDADGDLDTLLPLARVGAGGSTAGGGLYVLTRGASGALEAPRSLAPIAAVSIAAITLAAGAGVVVLDRANPFAREPSEAWVFALGASPSRVASPRGGVGATGLGVVDLDRDGRQDLLIASSDDSRLDILYGDEAGHFARTRTLSSPSATEVAVGDLDGDGAPDALVVGATVSRLLSRTEGEPALAAIEGAPALRDAQILDVDHDGRADVVGWSHPRLVVLAGLGDGAYETRTLFELAGGEVGPRRQVVADLDGDGAAEVVLLASGEDGGTRMLDLVVVPSSERGLVRTELARPMPDAPLWLDLTLPDPNAP